MEAYIFSSSLRELLRFRRIFPWLVVAVGVYGIALLYHRVSPTSTSEDAYIVLTSTLVFRILALSAAILSSFIVAQEVQQRTIVYLLTRPVPRWMLLIFRTLAAIVVVFGIGALTELGVAMVTHGSTEMVLHDLEALAIGAAAYVSLFAFVSLLVNRSMILCLLFAFVWETSVPNIPGDLNRLTISSYLTSIAQRPSPKTASGLLDALGGLLGANTIPPLTSWLVLAGLTLVCLGAASYWFGHFEYVAREDAE